MSNEVEEPEEMVMPFLIMANPTSPAGIRTKVVHNMLAVLGNDASVVQASLEAIGCRSAEPITELLIRFGFRSINAHSQSITMTDVWRGEEFWISTPAGVVAFWARRGKDGETPSSS